MWPSLVLLALISGAATPLAAQTERQQVLTAMAARPSDPWPRGVDHIVYAEPGSREEEKGYEEPGGSFSPAVGSFGIAIWVLDPRTGEPVRTSDNTPLSALHQRWKWGQAAEGIPELVIDTPDYQATWRLISTGKYALRLVPAGGAHLAVAVRSVGPAGGRVERLTWRTKTLEVNRTWTVRASADTRLLALGHEGVPGWLGARSRTPRWSGEDGWGYALIGTGTGGGEFLIRRTGPNAGRCGVTRALSGVSKEIEPLYKQLRFTSTRSTVRLMLPDQRFAESLDAQVLQLMMGLVRDETRPGEPTNYPLPWLRDGAYIVVALARTGQLDVAKQLAVYFGRHDFFGGFGPEADAPGLSLWALGEVGEISGDQAFVRQLWPDVERKAAMIVRMRHTTAPMYEDVSGPIVPSHQHDKELRLVCEAAHDGLIIGRMDWHRPLLFINAVSYAGLQAAARIAIQLGHKVQAEQWTAEASETQAAWKRAFATSEHDDERTYISSLWPTWAGVSLTGPYRELLEAQGTKTHDTSGEYRERPLWTYFDVAYAHQWLLLGDRDRTWRTLDWFWAHQSAPGLYTWWEGSGEENNFGRWMNVRGWVRPQNVTPHYWTSAEMLLLQLDMLAYLDRSAAEPTVVIGAGIPSTWLSKPMHVDKLSTEAGLVNWSWNGRLLRVKTSSPKVTVRVGAAFAGMPTKIERGQSALEEK